MAKIIVKAPYYKPGHTTDTGQTRGGYAKYIGTREGVQMLRGGMVGYIEECRADILSTRLYGHLPFGVRFDMGQFDPYHSLSKNEHQGKAEVVSLALMLVVLFHAGGVAGYFSPWVCFMLRILSVCRRYK